jgi:hypothetical protein
MIKNLGGVFGRNPTFNNVEVEGDLTVDGSIIGTVAAGGSNTQVQFNNAGVLDANAGLTYDSATETFRVRSHPTRYFTIGGNAAGASEILGYGNRPLSINSIESSIEIGDVGIALNGTCIVIDDPIPALSINCPNGTITVDSPTVTLIGTTASTSSTTGALIIAGGVGIAKDLFIDGKIDIGTSALITAPSATALAIKSTIPAGTGVTPTIQVICPSSATALTSGATAQNVFSPIGFDTITVQAATTYMFDGLYIIKTTGTVSHTISMSFALSGGASITNCSWTTMSYPLGTPLPVSAVRAQDGNFFAAVGGGAVNATNATAFNVVKFEGIMRVNAAGNVVPQITFSAAPGGTNTLEIGSYLKFYPIGANTIDSVGTAIG